MFRRIGQFLCNHIASRIHLAGWLRTRYTRVLEDEVARLRAENRALMNSILGGADIQPGLDARETASIAPLRRRSWQQIGRALEIGDARAARLERESDTETFPAPRNIVPRA